jgi:hypothetical protein
MSSTIGQIVGALTQGRPFVFMIMPYGEKYELFLHVQKAVEQSLGLACLRADDAKASGHDLLSKIHLLLERADLVIAEISPTGQPNPTSPNVFYEIGYAKALQKPLLLLIEEEAKVPTDLRGLEVIRHGGSRAAFERFDAEFRDHLKSQVTSRSALLRDMLLADEPRPNFVVASPKYPTGHTRIPGHVRDRRTFGDNLGVLGLISAFGAMLGEHSGLDLVSARFHALELSKTPANMYLVGSPKVNRLAGEIQDAIRSKYSLQFRLGRYPGEDESEDYRMAMYRGRPGKETLLKSRVQRQTIAGSLVHTSDHGIILRAPHPSFPDRIVMLMAGPHSLGTGAACLAATNSRLIGQVQEKLPSGVRLGDKKRAIYALVQGRVNVSDGHLDAEGVTVLEAGEAKPRKARFPREDSRASRWRPSSRFGRFASSFQSHSSAWKSIVRKFTVPNFSPTTNAPAFSVSLMLPTLQIEIREI